MTWKTWGDWLTAHTNHRKEKPRNRGLTMVMDKGLGMRSYDDLIELANPYIDFYKLGFGTSALTPTRLLQEKIEIAHTHQIRIYPGGTFFEIAYANQAVDSYLNTLRQLGFQWIEISDGTISISQSQRKHAIEQACELGFHVITEVGKKTNGSFLTVNEIVDQASIDFSNGATYVIIEGREAGTNVGIYDREGKLDPTMIKDVCRQINSDSLIFEAPLKHQQVSLLQLVGNHVNLGNISPTEIIAVEALRQHLRSDTFYINEE